jgi:hypothetical protein
MGAIGFFTNKPVVPPGPDGDKDDSSYDRTFTEVGESPPTYNENAKFGSATLKFTGNDQKLTTPANSNLNLGTAFTIDFWMRFDPYYVASMDSNGGAKIISNYEEITAGESTTYNGYEIGLYATGLGAKVVATYWYNNGLGTSVATLEAASDDALVSDGGWHHICFQRYSPGEGTEMALYVDGVRYDIDTNAGTNVHNTVTTTPFTIGARARADVTIEQPFLYGTIDELEVINGVAKYTTTGFTPPTTASTSTANHLLLMHFNSDNPAATVWYDHTDNNYWFTSGSWSGSAWTSFSSQWSAQYGWFTRFRPVRVRVTGTAVGGGTISLTNNDDFQAEFTIASGSTIAGPGRVITMDTTFESINDSNDDLKYWKNMTQFNSITKIEFDAKSNDPMPA